MNEQLQQTQPQTLAEGVSIWDSGAAMATATRMAEYLSRAQIIPQAYQGNPGNCLVAIDMGRRMGLSPVVVMQNSQMVRGNFSWKGSFCKALIDMSGRFRNSRYEYCGDPGSISWGCRLAAENAKTGRTVHGPWVTIKMATDEEWLSKPGSKWKTMPELMMRYRAAAFFARTECPEVLSGFHTAEEVIDIVTLQEVPESTENLTHPEIRYDDPPAQEKEEPRSGSERPQGSTKRKAAPDAPQGEPDEQVSLDDL